MKLFEMEGFLRGKCIPRDLKVNETNAEYLVRKFAEADAMCAALAAENAGLKKFIKADCWVWDDKNEEYIDAVDCMPATPATDAYVSERGE
ncbi:hypothetical protein [Enterobacter kobei]|uniref:hypothetical protein n=1 Tax=Enterobacter kobei TaxID=208224 RepID=UPI00298CE85F|nr:hypothetical protein [Enterobacter kobei]